MLNKPLLGLTVAAMLMVQVGCVASHWRSIERGNVDFAALFGAARLIRIGGVPDYDPTHVGVDRDSPPELPQRSSATADSLHPPFEALLFLPLTSFSYNTAFVVWTTVNLLLLWAVPYAIRDLIPRLHAEAAPLAILYGTFLPSLVCLMFGQDSIFLLFLLALCVSLLLRKHEWRAGFFLALGLFKFQLVLPVIAALAVMRYWRAVAGFISGFASLLLGSFLLIGPASTFGYFRFVFAYSRHISSNASARTVLMPNLRGLVSLVTGSLSPMMQSMIIVTLSVAVLIALLVWCARFSSVAIHIRFSLAVLVASVLSYHYYIYNAVILVIPFLLLANDFVDAKVSRRLRLIFAVSVLGSYGMLILGALALVPLDISMAALTLGTIGVIVAGLSLSFSRSGEPKDQEA